MTGATVAIGLLILLVMSIQSASADITSMRSQLDPTNQLLQQKLSRRQELMENITEAEAFLDNFTTMLESLDQQNNGVNGGLEVTVNSLPSTISLSSISHANSTLTINGRSPSEKEVLSYLRKLDASDRFAEITITSMRKIEGEGMDFTLFLRVGGQG